MTMTDNSSSNDRGHRLVAELLSDPQRFLETDGKSVALLESVVDGSSLELLRPLFAKQNQVVRQVAAFVPSELGRDARPVLDDVIHLLSPSSPMMMQSDALDVIAVCGTGERADRFSHVAEAMSNEHEGVRRAAMHLMAMADVQQLSAARAVFVARTSRAHVEGLTSLIENQNQSPVAVSEHGGGSCHERPVAPGEGCSICALRERNGNRVGTVLRERDA